MAERRRLRQGRRRRMTKFNLREISGVDHPAQQPALADIIKRDNGAPVTSNPPIEGETRDGYVKRMVDGGATADEAGAWFDQAVAKAGGDIVSVFTSSEEGHQHGVRVYHDEDGLSLVVMYASGADGQSHDHTIVRADDGWQISENHGHTHTLDADAVGRAVMAAVTKADHGWPLTLDGVPVEHLPGVQPAGTPTHPEDSMDLQKAQERIVALEAEIATLREVVEMVPAHRAHYDGLTKAAQPSFLALGFSARDAAVAEAEAADPIVYTDTEGVEYRKSDDPRMVALAKRADEDREAAAASAALVKDADLTKRADALAHLPGDVSVRKAMISALDAIEDEATRTAAHEALKSADSAMSGAFRSQGVRGAPPVDGSGPQAELDRLAKAYADQHGVSLAKANIAVLETAQGSELYNRARQR